VAQTGMPVRPAIVASKDAAYPEIGETGPLRLLVLGGSQGARILSEVVPAALARLPDSLRHRIEISQQCRPEDLEAVRAAYEGTGIKADLQSFFQDVPDRLAAAHLVIARSGASTVGELTVCWAVPRFWFPIPTPSTTTRPPTLMRWTRPAAAG